MRVVSVSLACRSSAWCTELLFERLLHELMLHLLLSGGFKHESNVDDLPLFSGFLTNDASEGLYKRKCVACGDVIVWCFMHHPLSRT